MESQNSHKNLVTTIEEYLTSLSILSNEQIKTSFSDFLQYLLEKARTAETCSHEKLKSLFFFHITSRLKAELFKIQQMYTPYHKELDCKACALIIEQVLSKIPIHQLSHNSRQYHLQEQSLRVEQEILHGDIYREHFKNFLAELKQHASHHSQPKVYIKFGKYHIKKNHEQWTHQFVDIWVKDLREAGVLVSIDGAKVNEPYFINYNDFVIVIGTESFAETHAKDVNLQLIIDKHNKERPLDGLFYNPILLIVLSGTYKSVFPEYLYSKLTNEDFSPIANFNQSGYVRHLKELLIYLYKISYYDDNWDALWDKFTQFDTTLCHLINGFDEKNLISHLEAKIKLEEEKEQERISIQGNFLGIMINESRGAPVVSQRQITDSFSLRVQDTTEINASAILTRTMESLSPFEIQDRIPESGLPSVPANRPRSAPM